MIRPGLSRPVERASGGCPAPWPTEAVEAGFLMAVQDMAPARMAPLADRLAAVLNVRPSIEHPAVAAARRLDEMGAATRKPGLSPAGLAVPPDVPPDVLHRVLARLAPADCH